MVGLLGIAAAGAVGGARDVSNANAEVDREALRQKYERQYDNEVYKRNRADQKEDAAAAGKAEGRRYERGRADALKDKEDDREFRAGESAKDRASRRELANTRSAGKGGSGKGADTGTRSTLGKQMADLIDAGIAVDAEHAFDLMMEKGIVSQVAANQFLDDPQQLQGLVEDFRGQRKTRKNKTANPQDTYLDFNPDTGFQ